MAIFTNQARLTYNGISVNSNIVTGEILSTLSVSKTALGIVYRIGQRLVYAISILNEGTRDLDGLNVSDDLGGYLFNGETLYPLTYVSGSLKYFVNGVLQGSAAVVSERPLSLRDISVPAGGNTMLLYETQVNEFASPVPGSTIENTITVSGDGVTSATASETVNADTSPVLSISKSLSPVAVPENGRLTYTFVIENSGRQTVATDDLSVIDIFDPALSDLSVTLDGAPFTAYAYDQLTGTFTTTPGAITVPGATFFRDSISGQWQIDPGSVVLAVSGTI